MGKPMTLLTMAVILLCLDSGIYNYEKKTPFRGAGYFLMAFGLLVETFK